MAYPTTTSSVLAAMGYIFDKDYTVKKRGEAITVQWLHTDPQPTEQEITDIATDTTPLPSGKTFTQSQEPEHYETSTGIKMATDLQSQAAFSNMMTLLNEASMADTDPVAIKDCFGVSHDMTVADFRTHAVAYGLYCYQIFHS